MAHFSNSPESLPTHLGLRRTELTESFSLASFLHLIDCFDSNSMVTAISTERSAARMDWHAKSVEFVTEVPPVILGS